MTYGELLEGLHEAEAIIRYRKSLLDDLDRRGHTRYQKAMNAVEVAIREARANAMDQEVR